MRTTLNYFTKHKSMPKKIKTGVGAEIYKLRVLSKISQKKLAEMIGYHPMHLNHIETSTNKPSMKMLEDIARVTDTQLVITFVKPQSAFNDSTG